VTPYRLLALDIDGTLLRRDKTLSPRTRDALQAAREAGVHVVLVTGRRYPAARGVAERLGGWTDLVLHNGALIVEAGPQPEQAGAAPGLGRTPDGAVILHRALLPRELARRAIRAGRAAGVDPVVHAGACGEGQLLVEGVSPSNTLLAYYLDRSHRDVSVVDDLLALQDDPVQVMFGGAIADMERLLPDLTRELEGRAAIERTVYPDSGVGLLDVLAGGVGKREAVAFLQRRFAVEPHQTIAIGDNWNDREMLLAAGLGLVMGNAEDGLRALGLPVLPTNDEDGVAVALERHVLGQADRQTTVNEKRG
jgi:hydroxymethylpyrimidine pyrophosphatase-like HAD family hydrolase